MMGDYIDREKLIQAISEDSLTTLLDWDSSLMDLIMTEIQECPAADVAPVVHGRWIKDEFFSDAVNNAEKCSQCGELIGWFGKLPKYCPNCGARCDYDS